LTGALGSSTDFRVMSTEAAVTARVELTGTGTCGATPVKSATKLGVVDAQPQRQRIEAALVERFQIVDEAALRVLRKPSRLPR
jgi:hypothetical protein